MCQRRLGQTERMSWWLAASARYGTGPAHGNAIGAATLPLFIQSVIALRSRTGNGEGYLQWRREWYELGRYSAEPGRSERVETALKIALGRPPLRPATG